MEWVRHEQARFVGESLESILASIRRSLAEQATGVLEEEAIAPVELLPSSDPATDLDIPPIPASLAQRLSSAPDRRQSAPTGVGGVAASGVDAPPPVAEGAPAVLLAARTQARTPTLTVVPAPAVALAAEPGQLRDPVIVPAPAVAPTPVVAPDAADAAPGQKDDPLWFLCQEAGPRAAAQPAGACRHRPPSRNRRDWAHVRGPLPPFFGSSAEAVKVEMAPDPPVLSGAGAMPPLTPAFVAPPPPPAAQPVDGATHGQRRGPARPGCGAAGVPTSGQRENELDLRASARRCPDGRGRRGRPQPQIQALEAMVAELLRPMLRRWLDENMPRLVSAALKAEADLMSESAIPRSLELSAAAA